MDTNYDVAIVGGSFAGLAVAMQLQNHRTVLIDQYAIGEHQMSACGTPLTTARAVGADASTLQVHNALVLHTAGREIRFPLQDPFVTFDYRSFCQAMLKQTDADVWRAHANAYGADRVETSLGTIRANFVVNATGWRAQSTAAQRLTTSSTVGYGLETTVPIRWEAPGLHFHVERDLVRNGYAWVFPCGETTRFGVGSFTKEQKLRAALQHFLHRFGLEIAETHGGVLAIARRQPVEHGVFRVGDAAGQCLPVTGEGIRTAIFHGIHCGQAIDGVLAGKYARPEAQALYATQVHSLDAFHMRLGRLQTLVAHTPEWLLALAGQICTRPALTQRIMEMYLYNSGWFVGEAA